jgi:hypothetical protein
MLGPGNPVSAGPACVTADFRTNPTNIAAIPNGIARTPTRTNTPPTRTHAATATHVPRRRGRKHVDCGKNRSDRPRGGLGLTAPRGGSPGEPRSRARVDGPIAGVCGEPIVAATSAPNPKFAC